MSTSIARATGLGLVWLLAATWLPALACGGAGSETDPGERASLVEEIRARWPAAAPLLADAARSPALDSGRAFVVRSVPARSKKNPSASDRWSTTRREVSVEVAADGRSMLVDAGAGRALRVRRSGGDSPLAPQLDGGALAIVGSDGDTDVVLAARETGVEELWVAHSASAVPSYEVDLPTGWRMHRPRGFAGLVEILDARGAPALRLVARYAWDASGRSIPVEPSVDDNRIRIHVPEDAEAPLLIDPEWQQVGAPFDARERATATLLPNGKVLFAGGQQAFQGEPVATAELFDPSTNTFAAAGVMSTTRSNHAAVTLRNGVVLIAGGADETNAVVGTAELYHPDTGTFEPLAAPMKAPRSRFSMSLLADGRVLLAGGAQTHKSDCIALEAGEVASAEVFDPATHEFVDVGSMARPRADHTATLLPDGRVVVAGGQGPEDGDGNLILGAVEIFDPTTNDFSPGGVMTKPRRGHVAVLLADGHVLVAGGQGEAGIDVTSLGSGELYDPATETSTATNGLYEPRAYAAAARLPDGRVLIAAGQGHTFKEFGCYPLVTTELFVPDALGGAFEIGPPEADYDVMRPTLTMLPTGRALLLGRSDSGQLFDGGGHAPGPSAEMLEKRNSHAAALLRTGDVLIVGGDDADLELATTEIYRTATGTVDPGPAMSTARTCATATTLRDGRVLVAGGSKLLQPGGFTSAEIYDQGKFETVGAMAVGRWFHTATLLPSGKVLLVGGMSNGSVGTKTAEEFDPATGTFEPTTTSMESARLLHTATLLPTGEVLVVGGKPSYTAPETHQSAELYDPATRTFRLAPEMQEPRWQHTASLLPDGRVLIAGGATTGKMEIYDAAGEGTFSPAASGKRRYGATATMLPSGKIAFIGGNTGSPGPPPIDVIEVFDPVKLFEPASSKPAPLLAPAQKATWWHTATLLPSGDVLVTGGVENGVAEFPIVAKRWEILTEEPTALAAARPAIAGTMPATVEMGKPVTLQGANLLGIPAPGGFPAALWMGSDGSMSFGSFAPWSTNELVWTPRAAGAPATGLLFAVTAGVRSVGRPLALTPAAKGAACIQAVSCGSGFCEDGVCCNEACGGGGCRGCSTKTGAASDGTCTDAPAGEDPKDTCEPLPGCEEVTGVCDGKGACRACPVVECADDGTLLVEGQEPRSCAPFRCSKDLKNCLVACTSGLDCVAGYSCTADGKCAAPLVDDPPQSSCAAARPSGTSHASWLVWAFAAALLARPRRPSSGRHGRA